MPYVYVYVPVCHSVAVTHALNNNNNIETHDVRIEHDSVD